MPMPLGENCCCNCTDDTKIGMVALDNASPFHKRFWQLDIENGASNWDVDINSEDAGMIGAVSPLGKGRWTTSNGDGRLVLDSSGVLDTVSEGYGFPEVFKFRYRRLSLPKYHGSSPTLIDPETVKADGTGSRTFPSFFPDVNSNIYDVQLRPDGGVVVCGCVILSGTLFSGTREQGIWVYDKSSSLLWKETWTTTVTAGVADNTASTYGVTVDKLGAVYHLSKDDSGNVKFKKFSSGGGSPVWSVSPPTTISGSTISGPFYLKDVYNGNLFVQGLADGWRCFVAFSIYDGSTVLHTWPDDATGLGTGHSYRIVTPRDCQVSRTSGWAVALVQDFTASEWIFLGWPCTDGTVATWSRKSADGDIYPLNSTYWSIGPC